MGDIQGTNTLDKKALNLEMLKIAGFTCTGGIWTYPDGVDVDNGVPFFPGDETACFKWIVPMLWICNMTMEEGIFFVWEVGHPKYRQVVKGPAEETSALAFCLAIQKLIKE